MAHPELRRVRFNYALTLLLLPGLAACREAQPPVSEALSTQSPTLAVEIVESSSPAISQEALARRVLRETAESVCPRVGELEFSPTGLAFHCAPSAGHGTSVSLERYGTNAEALAAFDAARGEHPRGELHGFPLSAWGEDDPSFPGGREEHQIWLWLGGRWLVEIRAFDDTPHLVAPDPEEVSEELHRLGIEQGLFAEAGG